MAFTRRRVLTVGLGGAALLGAGGLLRWLSSGYALPPGDVALALSTKEMVVVRALVDALAPGDDGLPAGIALGVHQRVDEEVWAQPDEVRADLKAALMLIEHGTLAFGALGRFSSLPRAERAEVLRRMLVSGAGVVVQAAVAFKQLVHLQYFAHPEVWPHIGYDGPWVKEPRPPESHLRYHALLVEARAAVTTRST